MNKQAVFAAVAICLLSVAFTENSGVRDYSLHSTVARGFDDSGWVVGPTLPYKIREELPVTRPECVSNRPLSV